ncbi:MAG: imidazole glycerol phosphate synthase subunit HisH [Candidatus Endolissoclinum sp. TMED37]|nr:MAG: imidazole glycerol phosphate synthase subunit HisH [Candidatus Endolissoclinum sp. TMED37]
MVTILDLEMSNLGSLKSALHTINQKFIVTNDVELIKESKYLILPGVGAFGDGINKLKLLKLDKVIKNLHKKSVPILGICLGMQLLAKSSNENGHNKGLNIFDHDVKRFSNKKVKRIPNIGWCKISIKKNIDLLKDIKNMSYFYFLHSYYLKASSKINCAETSNNQCSFSCVVKNNKTFGVQFHPEKSHDFGLILLSNFCSLK